MAGFVTLAVLLLADHVRDGGFLSDDWLHRARIVRAGSPIDEGFEMYGDRPGLALYVGGTHGLFEGRAAVYLLLCAILAGLCSAALYVLARELRLGRGHAAALGLLLLVFPFAASTRLWVIGGMIELSLLLFLAGAVAAVRAARATERGAAAGLTIAALVLWVASVATYELAAALVLAGLALLAWRAADRAAKGLAIGGALLAAGAMAFQASRDSVLDFEPAVSRWEGAELLVRQGLEVLARSLLPVDGVAPWLVLVVAGLVAVTLAVVVRGLDAGDPRRGESSRWLLVAAAGVVVAGLGYAPLLPIADPAAYAPRNPGLGDRVNAVAAVGHVLAVYGLIAAVATMLAGAGRDRTRRLVPLVAVPVAALSVAYAVRTLDDASAYQRSASIQEAILFAIDANHGKPAPGETMFTFRHPRYVEPGVPVFAFSWDLDGAAFLRWRQADARAFPIGGGVELTCGPDGVDVAGGGLDGIKGLYGATSFVDITDGRVARLADVAACERAKTSFEPGPDFPG